MQQRDYQIKGTDRISELAQAGFQRILLQLATGGGKTVMFAGLCQRYLRTNEQNILILVHRKELLKQARKTIYNWYNLIAEPITAKTRHVPPARIYVAMVETAYKRLQKRPSYFPNIGMVIVDECHLMNFAKMLPLFPDTIRIGFTATPISSSKKTPLKNYYEEIVTCIDIKGLIEIWEDDHSQGLAPNRTFRVKNRIRAGLKVKGDDFDEIQMASTFSSAKHVENTVDAYEKFCKGTKTMVFNCNVEHSKLVNHAFRERGYNSRHIDADKLTDDQRDEVLEWFANTPDAILNNIGILTTGFDEPSVQSIIVNKATMSLSLWLQMTGRGARPYPGKLYFTIIDMGGNEKYHGDWSNERDWVDIFHNPDKPMEGGVAPTKECEHCEAIIAAQARVCKFCGGIQSQKDPVYDPEELEFELVVKHNPFGITTQQAIMNNLGRNPYAALHQIKHELINHARQAWKMAAMTDDVAYKLLGLYQDRVEEWCREQKKNYDSWHKETTGGWFLAELKRVYGWEPAPLQLAI
jgi:superfamily II DNA or RNA helicase